MKTQSLSALVALASGIQLAAADGWLDAPGFQCPGNSDNHCSSEQSGGFDWTGLSTGSFSSYGGFDFDNWQCADSFAPTKRGASDSGFQSKCITGVASSDHSSCPSFGCGSDSSVPNFSVDTFQVSVEFDCSLDFHYGMPDGSTCKQTSPCSKGGSTIKNTQCGGAKNVTVVYPGGGPKPTCSVGVHSIGFDCSSHSSHTYSATTPPQYSTTAPAYTTTTSVSAPETTPTTPVYSATTPSSSPASETSPTTPVYSATSPSSSPASETSPTTPVYSATSPSSSSPASETSPTTPVYSATSPSSSSPASSTVITSATYAVTTVSTAQGVTAPTTTASAVVPTYSIYNTTSAAGVTSSEVYTTVVVDTTTTVCPFTSTHVSGGTTSIETGTTTSTILITSYSTVSPTATVPYATSSAGGVASSSASPLPYPSILPQCLNTWIPLESNCNSNADTDCYCPSESLVCSVYECLYAHGATDSDIASAQNYFMGLCVNQIGSNPAILTCSSEVSGATTYPSGPVTTVTVESTVVVPCSESGTVIPYSSSTTVYTTSVVVPQVVLTTVPGPASTIALVTGTPAPATYTAQTYPAATTVASVTVPAASNTVVGTARPSFTNSAPQTGLGFSSLLAAVIFVAAFAL